MLRDVNSTEIFTFLIMVGLTFIAIAKVLFPKRFDDFTLVLGNSKYLKIYAREQKFLDRFDALLFINLILSISIFCIIAYQSLNTHIAVSVTLMFKLVFGIGVFILIKVLVERLLGSLFDIDSLIDHYLFQKISYKNFIGLVLIPVNALLLFTFTPSAKIIYVILFLLFAIIIIGLITSIKSYQSLIKNNLFYFILYLCALEIAPYVILYKVLMLN